MSKLTILDVNQVNNLDIFKKYGIKAKISDYAICTGGYVSNKYVNEENSLKNRTGFYWTKTTSGSDKVCVIDSDGSKIWSEGYHRHIGCRPVLPFSEMSIIFSNKVREINDIIEYGEYPQSVAKNQKELKKLFKKMNYVSQLYQGQLFIHLHQIF